MDDAEYINKLKKLNEQLETRFAEGLARALQDLKETLEAEEVCIEHGYLKIRYVDGSIMHDFPVGIEPIIFVNAFREGYEYAQRLAKRLGSE